MSLEDSKDGGVRDPQFEEMYYGEESNSFSSTCLRLDIIKNALEALGFHRYHEPGKGAKSEDLEYYVNEDESVVIRLSDRPAIIGYRRNIEFDDLKSFEAFLSQNPRLETLVK
jgi:hypothetical protein